MHGIYCTICCFKMFCSILCLSIGTGGVYPAPVIPGVLPAAMQPLQMGALNYLGQPITAAQMPAAGMAGVGGANNPGMADLNMLSAAYSMQGVPGMVSAANLLHPNQYILNNDISSGFSTIQSKNSSTVFLPTLLPDLAIIHPTIKFVFGIITTLFDVLTNQ